MPPIKIGRNIETEYGPGVVLGFQDDNHVLVELVNKVTISFHIKSPYNLDKGKSIPKAMDTRKTAPDTKTVKSKLSFNDQIHRVGGPRKNTIDTSKFPVLKALDSLRFGLVPEAMIEQLTVNFEELENLTHKWLPNPSRPKANVIEIVGQYGTGKTHTMAVIRQIALNNGYVTARVEVDGQKVSLADPQGLLSALWSNLRAKDLDTDLPLLELYFKAMEKNREAPHFAPKGIDRIADNYGTIRMLKRKAIIDEFATEYNSIISSHNDITASELNAMITRHDTVTWYLDEPVVRPMIGRQVQYRPYDFIEDLFGHATLCKLAGYKGLVLTIDEFEIEHNGVHFDRVEDLIGVLEGYLSGETDHATAPCTIFIATVNQAGQLGDEVIDDLVKASNGYCHHLAELEWEAVFKLGRKLHDLYCDAYNLSVEYDPALTKKLFNRASDYTGRIRGFIKLYMAYLDNHYGPSQRP